MGPITLFDKSFLQSLSVDESVWFDHFFLANICPLFYVESLADLHKQPRADRTSEDEVTMIARKFPEMRATPNMHHVSLCLSELHGHYIPLTGQIMVPGGKPVKVGDQSGVVYEQSPEEKAFSRWQRGEFQVVEHQYAYSWRKGLAQLDLEETARHFRNLGIDGKSCKDLTQAKTFAETIVANNADPIGLIHLALLFLGINPRYHHDIIKRWEVHNFRPLPRYAPFVAHVLTVELFFQFSLAANLISSQRPSNRIDMAYLFYLPFCMVFVSSDKLHRRCAPLFLRSDQEFIWGPDLKQGLRQVNDYYSEFSEEEKDKGVMSFAGDPPKEGGFFVADVWDRHFPNWRNRQDIQIDRDTPTHDELLEHVTRFSDSPRLTQEEIDFDVSDPDTITRSRMVSKKKGSWFQVPKDIEPSE